MYWIIELKVHINKQINKSLTNSALEIQFLECVTTKPTLNTELC